MLPTLPSRRASFISCMTFIGSCTMPIHRPLTKTLHSRASSCGVRSCNVIIYVFLLNQLKTDSTAEPGVILAAIAKCLCKPAWAPSGVSTGSMIPHCEPCNFRMSAGTLVPVLETVKFSLRKCAINELWLKRFTLCTTPTRMVYFLDPQRPLNALFIPSATIRLSKNVCGCSLKRTVLLLINVLKMSCVKGIAWRSVPCCPLL